MIYVMVTNLITSFIYSMHAQMSFENNTKSTEIVYVSLPTVQTPSVFIRVVFG